MGLDDQNENMQKREKKKRKMLLLVRYLYMYMLFSVCRRAYVDHPCCVALFEVIQHGGFREVGHHGHVLNLIILGRVHRVYIILLYSSFLKVK